MSIPRISPYPHLSITGKKNRTTWTASPHRSLLLIHDMQNHFVDSFQRGQGTQIDQAIEHIRALRTTAQQHNIPTVYTAQPPNQRPEDRRLLTDFWGPGLSGENAARIIDELTPHKQDTILTKWRYSAFYRSDLKERMHNRGLDQIIITGVYSHIGCLTTALDAFMHGFQVFFAADAQADFSPEEQILACNYVSTRCGQVSSTPELIEAIESHA